MRSPMPPQTRIFPPVARGYASFSPFHGPLHDESSSACFFLFFNFQRQLAPPLSPLDITPSHTPLFDPFYHGGFSDPIPALANFLFPFSPVSPFPFPSPIKFGLLIYYQFFSIPRLSLSWTLPHLPAPFFFRARDPLFFHLSSWQSDRLGILGVWTIPQQLFLSSLLGKKDIPPVSSVSCSKDIPPVQDVGIS